MYDMTEAQWDTLSYILEHLSVTGTVQAGLLSNAGGILAAVKTQRPKKRWENPEFKEGKDGSKDSTGNH